jgi:hypothetical protein
LSVVNSTVSDNTNGGGTSAAVNFAFTSVPQGSALRNVTIAGNTGRGLVQSAGNVRVENSIVAGNSGVNCAGTITNGGFNLSDTSDCPGFTVANPRLGSLANNGGPTLTRMPDVGSPALDQIPASLCPAADQRGVARPLPAGGLCDIGAVERQPTTYVYVPLIRR